MISYKGKKAVIVGEGISGSGAKFALESVGAECFFYSQASDLYKGIDLIVVSPGVPKSSEIFGLAKQHKIPIIGEIELGFSLCDKPIIAVTGTNGKTTITELIGAILRYDKKNPIVCGNIGVAFSAAALEKDFDVAVVEVSSFQLETIKKFRPQIAIISNITEDHLDRHKTFANYAKAKFSIAKYQTESDYLIMPSEVACFSSGGVNTEKICGKIKSKICCVDTNNSTCIDESQPINISADSACFEDSGRIFFDNKLVAYSDDIGIKGRHNQINAMLAVSACKLLGVSDAAIRLGLKLFRPRAYRMALCGEHHGIKYYNDSKATNIDACLCACRAMVGDTCLIVGGSEKGYDFDTLFVNLPKNIVKIFAVGQTAKKILDSAKKQSYSNIEFANSIREATVAASNLEIANILLSPAAASFDAYANYEERGRDFDNIVGEIMQIETKKWTI